MFNFIKNLFNNEKDNNITFVNYGIDLKTKRNILALGLSGSGKTVSVLAPYINNWEGKVVVFDVYGVSWPDFYIEKLKVVTDKLGYSFDKESLSSGKANMGELEWLTIKQREKKGKVISINAWDYDTVEDINNDINSLLEEHNTIYIRYPDELSIIDKDYSLSFDRNINLSLDFDNILIAIDEITPYIDGSGVFNLSNVLDRDNYFAISSQHNFNEDISKFDEIIYDENGNEFMDIIKLRR